MIVITGRRTRSLRVGELNTGILRDYVRYAGGDQRDRAVVVALLEKRDGLASEAADFSVGKNALQTVADCCPVLSILNRIQNEDAAIASLLANSPLLVKLYRVVEDVAAIQRIDSNDGYLRVSLVIELLGDVVEIGSRASIEDVREVVNVVARLELRDGLCIKQDRQKKKKQQDSGVFHASQHLR